MRSIRPDLLIRGEQTAISTTPQTDAEGQAILRRVQVDAPAGPQGGAPIGQIPAIIEYKTQVGEHAAALKTNCGTCRHFDSKAWKAFVWAATGPASTAEDRQTIDTLRKRIATDGKGLADENGNLDVEATLMSIGICRVLSDWTEGIVGRNPIYWPVAPTPDATCPTSIVVPGGQMQIVTPAEPFGLFKPRDLDARKMGDKRRDDLLFAAQAGKR